MQKKHIINIFYPKSLNKIHPMYHKHNQHIRTENDRIWKKNKINNDDKWNYCHHFTLLKFLGVNHRLPLFHMSENFVYLNNTEEHINEFTIGYMANPTLHVNKVFKYQ